MDQLYYVSNQCVLFLVFKDTLSPVHTGDKVEFNTVDFVESRLSPKQATKRQQREFDSLSRSTLLSILSSLLPVCTGPKPFTKVDRVEFNFVANVYWALSTNIKPLSLTVKCLLLPYSAWRAVIGYVLMFCITRSWSTSLTYESLSLAPKAVFQCRI